MATYIKFLNSNPSLMVEKAGMLIEHRWAEPPLLSVPGFLCKAIYILAWNGNAGTKRTKLQSTVREQYGQKKAAHQNGWQHAGQSSLNPKPSTHQVAERTPCTSPKDKLFEVLSKTRPAHSKTTLLDNDVPKIPVVSPFAALRSKRDSQRTTARAN